MSTVKLSDWWDALLEKKNPDGVTVIQIDTEYLPEIRMRMKSLESEVQRLKEENAEWERWNTRCRQTKEEWGRKLTEAESRLAKAQELAKKWKTTPHTSEAGWGMISRLGDELEVALGAGGEDEKK